MIFNSAAFLFLFLPLVFLADRLIPGTRGKNLWLCAASLLFYAFGGVRHVPLLLLCALLCWGLGLLLRREKGPRRLWRALGVCLPLGMLAVFKYLDFLLSTVNALLSCSLPLPGLSTPAGVSFFTFLAVSYVLDVSREPSLAFARFADALLYIAFFPRLLSGPLVRCGDTAPQLRERAVTAEDTAAGLRRFVRGLGKKVLIADILAGVADALFAHAGELTAPLAWLGAVCYALQLFFDFSGYSDMAIGLGRVFGFVLPENFDYPYISRTVREFWRRWHITLSRWFRDYVYIPLRGNRRGAARTALNSLLVFLLTGLWHGAGWTFVLWGLWHGLFLVLENSCRDFFRRLERSLSGRAALHLYALLAVVLGFVLFRAESVGQAWTMLGRMFSFAAAPESRAQSALLWNTAWNGMRTAALCAALLLSAPVARRVPLPEGAAGEAVRNAGALLLFLLCLLAVAGSGFTPFIYFQF